MIILQMKWLLEQTGTYVTNLIYLNHQGVSFGCIVTHFVKLCVSVSVRLPSDVFDFSSSSKTLLFIKLYDVWPIQITHEYC